MMLVKCAFVEAFWLCINTHLVLHIKCTSRTMCVGLTKTKQYVFIVAKECHLEQKRGSLVRNNFGKYKMKSTVADTTSIPVVNVAVTGSLLMSPFLEMSDTLYSLSGIRPSMLYCLSGGEIITTVSSEASEVGP